MPALSTYADWLAGSLLTSALIGLFLPAWAMASASAVRNADNQAAIEQAGGFDYGLLWRVDNKTGGDPSYLFGTMHVEDPRVLNLPQPVLDAFNQSQSLTLEALLSLDQIVAAGTELLLQDGSTLVELVGTERFKRISTALVERDMPPQFANLLKSWAVAVLLAQPASESGMFLDRKLQHMALQKGLAVSGLETLQEQLQIFNNMSVQDQVTLIDETLAQFESIPQIIEELIQAYLDRDLLRLRALADEQFEMSTVQQGLKHKLLADRNLKMIEKMHRRIEEGGAFIAVGALHLSDKQGLLQLLQNSGYTLTRIY